MAAPRGLVLRKRIWNICLGHMKTLYTGTCHTSNVSVAEEKKEPRSLFRTNQSDPTEQSNNQEGLYFTIPDEYAKRFYKKGQRDHFLHMVKSFNETAVMVRRPALEVINYLKDANYEYPVLRYLLYGTTGGGKTLSMSHVMHYCALNDWLIVHVPWAAKFTRHAKVDTGPSVSKPERVDVVGACIEWLNYFQQINAPFLSKHNVTVEGNYTWSKRDFTEAGSPLQQLISFAAERPKSANDIMNVVLKEIKQQANQGKFKVLVAVDGVNCFWQQTLIKREDDSTAFYHASELSVVHSFKKLFRNDWTGGAVLCTVDKRASIQTERESDFPIYLLRQGGFELFDPFVPVSVDNYTEKEFHSNVEYYLDRHWIHRPGGLSTEARKELSFLSCKNPYELYKVTKTW